jgi:hypothetical protein
MDARLLELQKLSRFVKASFNWCNISFGELWYLTQTPNSKEEIELARSHTFSFYGITLQYCFVMEYCKLLERRDKADDRNIASLSKLNYKLKDFVGSQYLPKYAANESLIENLKSSRLYDKLKKLRDKKFGHSDGDVAYDPLSIKGFTAEDIDDGLQHLTILLEIANNCFKELGYEVIETVPHRDDRTANFIKFHAQYERYYLDNYAKAWQEGYR